MKVCASCGASLPDGAAFCIGCGSKEFRTETMPDLNAPEPEKPKIEYDQYGRPIGQDYSQTSQYEEPRFTQSYDDYSDSYSSTQSDYPQYIEQYTEQMSQSGQYDQSGYTQPYGQQQYSQGGYTQPYGQPQYDQGGYQQQYSQPQYDQGGYQQQYQHQQYDQGGYQQQYSQSQYDQGGYQQQYEQPAEQPVYSEQQYEEPVYEEPAQPVQPEPEVQQPQNYYHSEHTSADQIELSEEPVSDIDPYAAKKDEYDPYEAAKNFKFEKKEDVRGETTEQPEENPKDVKGMLAKFQNTNDHTLEYDANTFAANKQACKLAVLGITFWVPFVSASAKNCGAARFYANQGLLIFIAELILLIPELMFTGIIGVGLTLGAQIIIGIILDLIITAIIYCVPIFMILTAFKNIDQGKVKDIPFIGRFRIIK